MDTDSKKAMLIYPCGKLFQRGEDRCQGNIDDSTATAMRACNDLGYSAAVLEKMGYEIFLRDYQTEKKNFEDVKSDINNFRPDILLISVTNATIFQDISFAKNIKGIYPLVCIVLKGAIFYDPDSKLLECLDLDCISYLIGGETELCIGEIAEYEHKKTGDISSVDNILFRDETGSFQKTKFHTWCEDLDSIPFPARKYMNNSLYTRPDTGEPMATIQTSRGCSASCIYCLSPLISGKRIRYRSPENVLAELLECYNTFNIKNFFFKADTFTMNAEWIKSLCHKILASPLKGKISFTANSRVSPLDRETLALMKSCGCFAVAFGFESGSDETLKKIKKGTTVQQNLAAVKWAKELKIPIYGFFMIGFPWETEKHLKMTREHVFAINADFIEIHVALPYYGTEFYKICEENNILNESTLGSDYFNSNITGTSSVSIESLMAFRNKLILDYYLRPSYIFLRIADCIKSPQKFFKYAKYACRIVKNS